MGYDGYVPRAKLKLSTVETLMATSIVVLHVLFQHTFGVRH